MRRMARYIDEPDETVTKIDHVLIRTLNDIRLAVSENNFERAVNLVGLLETYAFSLANRHWKLQLHVARQMEEYIINYAYRHSKRAWKLVGNRVEGEISDFFALNVRLPLSIAALSPILKTHVNMTPATLRELAPRIDFEVKKILRKHNIPLDGFDLSPFIKKIQKVKRGVDE